MDPNFVVCLILYIFFFSYLSQDLPQLIEGRIDYFEPSFEAMIRSGVSFVFYEPGRCYLSHGCYTVIPQEDNTQGRPKRIYVVHGKATANAFVFCVYTNCCGRIALRRG